jgi:hypothetical protein
MVSRGFRLSARRAGICRGGPESTARAIFADVHGRFVCPPVLARQRPSTQSPFTDPDRLSPIAVSWPGS